LFIGKNVEQNVDYVQLVAIDMFEGLLVKYAVLCGVSGHRDGDNIFKRLVEHNFPRRIPSTEEKCKPTRWCVFCSKYNKRERLYTIVITVILLCMSVGVSKPTVHKKISEVM
jgi:hypothetical protein